MKAAQTYKYETHLHTGETSVCGRIKGAEAVRLYKAAGYDGIIVTDHYNRRYFQHRFAYCSGNKATWTQKLNNFLSGYKGALEEGKRLGFAVFLGMEIRFDGSRNDYLVYGIDEVFLRENPDLYCLDLQSFRRLLQEKLGTGNFLLYQAHPFRPGNSPADPSVLDGVEVYNGNPRHDSHNELALAFADQNRLGKISGSDFHRRVDTGRGGIILPKKITRLQDLFACLKANQGIELMRTTGAPWSLLRLLTVFVDRFK